VKNKITTQSQLSKLASFRQSLYQSLTKARDALFELSDAVLTSPGIASFPELSCALLTSESDLDYLQSCAQQLGVANLLKEVMTAYE
jgi:hypothetical protein